MHLVHPHRALLGRGLGGAQGKAGSPVPQVGEAQPERICDLLGVLIRPDPLFETGSGLDEDLLGVFSKGAERANAAQRRQRLVAAL